MLGCSPLRSALLLFFFLTTPAYAMFPEDFEKPVDADMEQTFDAVDAPSPTQSEESDAGLEEKTVPALPATPSGALTRAEFTHLLVAKLYSELAIDHCFYDIAPTSPPSFSLLFNDVPVTHPSAKHICIAMRDGLVDGYRDYTFHPDAPITTAEGMKILARALSIAPYAEAETRGPWYRPYAQAIAARHAIPDTLKSFTSPLTAQDLNEMLARIQGDITWLPATSYDDLVRRSAPPMKKQITPQQLFVPPAVKPGVPTVPSSNASSASSLPQSASSEGRSWWNPF